MRAGAWLPRLFYVEGKGNAVLGYYTLSALSVDVGAWPRTWPGSFRGIRLSPRRCSAGSRLISACAARAWGNIF